MENSNSMEQCRSSTDPQEGWQNIVWKLLASRHDNGYLLLKGMGVAWETGCLNIWSTMTMHQFTSFCFSTGKSYVLPKDRNSVIGPQEWMLCNDCFCNVYAYFLCRLMCTCVCHVHDAFVCMEEGGGGGWHLYCSAQLSMFNMEKCNRNIIIIIIILMNLLSTAVSDSCWNKMLMSLNYVCHAWLPLFQWGFGNLLWLFIYLLDCWFSHVEKMIMHMCAHAYTHTHTHTHHTHARTHARTQSNGVWEFHSHTRKVSCKLLRCCQTASKYSLLAKQPFI